MKKIVLVTAVALAAMTGSAMADPSATDMIMGGVASNAKYLSSDEMSSITGGQATANAFQAGNVATAVNVAIVTQTSVLGRNTADLDQTAVATAGVNLAADRVAVRP